MCQKLEAKMFKIFTDCLSGVRGNMDVLSRGMGYALQLREHGWYSNQKIKDALVRAWHSTEKRDLAFPENEVFDWFPFLSDTPSTKWTPNVWSPLTGWTPSVWGFMKPHSGIPLEFQINHEAFIMDCINFRVPDSIWLEVLKRIIEFDFPEVTTGYRGRSNRIPRLLASAGVALKYVDEFQALYGDSGVWDTGMVAWDQLYPSSIECIERKFPGFIEHMFNGIIPSKCNLQIITWLFTQNLTLPQQRHLLSFVHRCHRMVDKRPEFKKHFGNALQHINISVDTALELYRNSPHGRLLRHEPWVRFLLSKANETQFEIQIAMLNHLFDKRAILKLLVNAIVRTASEPDKLVFEFLAHGRGWNRLKSVVYWAELVNLPLNIDWTKLPARIKVKPAKSRIKDPLYQKMFPKTVNYYGDHSTSVV